jgi:hypothetical protein
MRRILIMEPIFAFLDPLTLETQKSFFESLQKKGFQKTIFIVRIAVAMLFTFVY